MNEQYVCECAGSTCNGMLEDKPCPYVKPHGPADCGAHCSHEECTPECTPVLTLDQKYQQAFKDTVNPPPGWMPPCPSCQGEMVYWDAWLVTGATCSRCGWNMSEGTGCLL